jgi:hypothetical protein
MKTRIFVSRRNEGWTEVEIPEEFQQYPYDKLVRNAHRFLGDKAYRGLLITQNPSPFSV